MFWNAAQLNPCDTIANIKGYGGNPILWGLTCCLWETPESRWSCSFTWHPTKGRCWQCGRPGCDARVPLIRQIEYSYVKDSSRSSHKSHFRHSHVDSNPAETWIFISSPERTLAILFLMALQVVLTWMPIRPQASGLPRRDSPSYFPRNTGTVCGQGACLSPPVHYLWQPSRLVLNELLLPYRI